MTVRQYQSLDSEKPVNSKPVFGSLIFGIVVFIVLITTRHFVTAQVHVTGHVFAEIVEPTALSARASNNHVINETYFKDENSLVLAEVKLSGGPDINIGVSVQSGRLEAENGETLVFDAFVCPECFGDNPNNLPDEKLYTLKGTPGENTRLNKNITFKGQYRVVFMYN